MLVKFCNQLRWESLVYNVLKVVCWWEIAERWRTEFWILNIVTTLHRIHHMLSLACYWSILACQEPIFLLKDIVCTFSDLPFKTNGLHFFDKLIYLRTILNEAWLYEMTFIVKINLIFEILDLYIDLFLLIIKFRKLSIKTLSLSNYFFVIEVRHLFQIRW